MQKQETLELETTIDLLRIFKALWRRVWVLILVSLLGAAAAFSYAAFLLVPQYSASVMLYVNSQTAIGDVGISISSGQLSAAQSLVKTYMVILNNRTTLEEVIEDAEVSYTYQELSNMISSSQVNNTEVFRVTVTSTDPYEAAKLVNSIAKVLPNRVTDIIDGSSMRIVDAAIPNLQKVAPSISKYTMIGFLLGLLLSGGVIVLATIFDDTLKSDDELLKSYDIPVLAKIPDLLNDSTNKYGYYEGSRRHHSSASSEGEESLDEE